MTARRATLLSMLAGAALIVAPAWSRPDIRFIWNASASVPVGLYRIVPGNHVDVTDLAVVMPPAELAAFLDERGYLPRGLPLIKRVLALGGTRVCRRDSAIIAYDGIYGQALARDRRGRPLPDWQGCRTLHDGEAFFMNWASPRQLRQPLLRAASHQHHRRPRDPCLDHRRHRSGREIPPRTGLRRAVTARLSSQGKEHRYASDRHVHQNQDRLQRSAPHARARR